MKISSNLSAVFILVLSLQGSYTYGMQLDAIHQEPDSFCPAVGTSKKISLPWDMALKIFREYFYALGIDDHAAIKDGLGVLLEACAISSYEKRSSILKLLETIYGPAHVTKLILACEVGNRPGVLEWILNYLDFTKELCIPLAHTTPLISAIGSMPQSDVLLFLRKASASINIPDETGYTPLMAAADLNNGKLVSSLLTQGAIIDSADVNGLTALHRAVEKGNYVAAEALLSAGANPNVRTIKEGFTPLYMAIMTKQVNSCSSLIASQSKSQ